MKPLLDNQNRAVDKLSKLKVGALFMEAGTGKTGAAIELIRSVTDVDYVLWLTPFQTKDNLRDEILKRGGLDCDIVGIETLSNSDRVYIDLTKKIKRSNTSFIVCDESLKIKNSSSKRTDRVTVLGKIADYKLILNGTPVSRNLLDLWPQMNFLSPLILNMNETEFKNTFCEYTTMTKRIGNRHITREWINKYHNVDYLYSLIEPYVFDAKLDLDKRRHYVNIDFDLTEDEKKNHDYIKNDLLNDDALIARNNNIFLELTSKLSHNYCCSPEKFDVVKTILSENDNSKVIIFTRFIDSRHQITKKFPNVKVLSIQSHSFGLNLQWYNRVIFWDKVWDYALRDQAEHRTYRTGQEYDCVYYDLTANCGLDRMINENIRKKQSLLEYFKNKSVKQLLETL